MPGEANALRQEPQPGLSPGEKAEALLNADARKTGDHRVRANKLFPESLRSVFGSADVKKLEHFFARTNSKVEAYTKYLHLPTLSKEKRAAAERQLELAQKEVEQLKKFKNWNAEQVAAKKQLMEQRGKQAEKEAGVAIALVEEKIDSIPDKLPEGDDGDLSNVSYQELRLQADALESILNRDTILAQKKQESQVTKLDDSDIVAVEDTRGVLAKTGDVLKKAQEKVTGFFKGLFGKKPKAWDRPEFQPDNAGQTPPPLPKEAVNLGNRPWKHESVQTSLRGEGNVDANMGVLESLAAQGGRVNEDDVLDVQSRMRGGNPDITSTSSLPDVSLEDAMAAADVPVGRETLREMKKRDELFLSTVRDLLSSNYIAPKAGSRELNSIPAVDRKSPSVIDLATFMNANPERTINTIDELEELGRQNPTLAKALELLSDRITDEIGEQAEEMPEPKDVLRVPKDVQVEVRHTSEELEAQAIRSGVDSKYTRLFLRELQSKGEVVTQAYINTAKDVFGKNFDQTKAIEAALWAQKMIEDRFVKKGRQQVSEAKKAA